MVKKAIKQMYEKVVGKSCQKSDLKMWGKAAEIVAEKIIKKLVEEMDVRWVKKKLAKWGVEKSGRKNNRKWPIKWLKNKQKKSKKKWSKILIGNG